MVPAVMDTVGLLRTNKLADVIGIACLLICVVIFYSISRENGEENTLRRR